MASEVSVRELPYVAAYEVERSFLLPKGFADEDHAGLKSVDTVLSDDGSLRVVCTWRSDADYRAGELELRNELGLVAPLYAGWHRKQRKDRAAWLRWLGDRWNDVYTPGKTSWAVLLSLLAVVATASTVWNLLVKGFADPDANVAADESSESRLRVVVGETLQARFVVANRARSSANVISAEGGVPLLSGPALDWLPRIGVTPASRWSPTLAPGTTHTFVVTGTASGEPPPWITPGTLALPVTVRGSLSDGERNVPAAGPAAVEIEVWPDLAIGPATLAPPERRPKSASRCTMWVEVVAGRAFAEPRSFRATLPLGGPGGAAFKEVVRRVNDRHGGVVQASVKGAALTWEIPKVAAFARLEFELALEATSDLSLDDWTSIASGMETRVVERP